MYEQALRLARESGNRVGGRDAPGASGCHGCGAGATRRRRHTVNRRWSLPCEVGNRAGEGTALNTLGDARRGVVQYAQAFDDYAQALAIVREVGDRAGRKYGPDESWGCGPYPEPVRAGPGIPRFRHGCMAAGAARTRSCLMA